MKKKKAKTGPAKKKDDKPESEAEAPTSVEPEEAKEEAPVENDEAADEPSKPEESSKSSHGRQPSMSIQSKLRSEYFRKASGPTSPGVTSPVPVLSPGEGAHEIYKKQAQRIEELERENSKLQTDSQAAETRWRKLEEELQELREADGDATELKIKAQQAERSADEVEKLVCINYTRWIRLLTPSKKAENASLQRQNSQLQTAASKRRQSTSVALNSASDSDLTAQLASKSDTISSLELEISNLNSKLSTLQTTFDTQSTKISTLESQLEKAESEAASAVKELSDLKANLDKASEAAKADGSARSSAETQIAQLEAELGTAKRNQETATKRAETLEKKIETLTTLHRESDARNQAKIADGQKHERDVKELRARVTALSNENGKLRDESQRRKKMEATGDAAGLEELEDEERERLRTQVRQLEEEVLETRRGVWRDKRREMQPGLDDDAFDDVDLSASPARKQPAHSSFQDVIQSGISAFTGSTNRRNSTARGRGQSVGLMDDDDDFAFDEDAFRKAQEDEAMSRLERVKEVKRGLKSWEGWRVDIADLRAGMGGVFEV